MMLSALVGGRHRKRTTAVAGASSALATLAASLSAGQWGELTSATGQNATLGLGITNGSMLPQTNEGHWCAQTATIELVGQDHGGGGSGSSGWGMRHAKYTESTDAFSTVEAQSGVFGLSPQHSYDHTAINPSTGDLYGREGLVGVANVRVWRKPLSDRSVWLGAVPTLAFAEYQQIAVGTCWWSGSFTAGTQPAGAEGCFMIFHSGASAAPPGSANDGVITAYDPVEDDWIYNQNGRAPFYGAGGTSTYHSIMEYSAGKNCAVYGGGNVANRSLWKMASDGTVTQMTQVPSGKTVGVAVGENAGRLVADPVTGNFLLLCAGELWELNPDGSGTWTQATSPPAGVGDPDAAQWVTSVALPDHGCVAFIRQDNATNHAFWLYKHA